MYIYSPHTSNRRYIWHQNNIPSYFYILLYTISFIYWLWHQRCCGRHHIDDHLEDYLAPSGHFHYDWRIYTSSDSNWYPIRFVIEQFPEHNFSSMQFYKSLQSRVSSIISCKIVSRSTISSSHSTSSIFSSSKIGLLSMNPEFTR